MATSAQLAKRFPVEGFARRGAYQIRDYDQQVFGALCIEVYDHEASAGGIVGFYPLARNFKKLTPKIPELVGLNSTVGSWMDMTPSNTDFDFRLRSQLADAAVWIERNASLDRILEHLRSMNTALTRLGQFEIDIYLDRGVFSTAEYYERYRTSELTPVEIEYLSVNHPAVRGLHSIH